MLRKPPQQGPVSNSIPFGCLCCSTDCVGPSTALHIPPVFVLGSLVLPTDVRVSRHPPSSAQVQKASRSLPTTCVLAAGVCTVAKAAPCLVCVVSCCVSVCIQLLCVTAVCMPVHIILDSREAGCCASAAPFVFDARHLHAMLLARGAQNLLPYSK